MPNTFLVEASGVKPCFYNGTNEPEVSILEEVRNIKIKFTKKTRFHSIAEIQGLNVSIANALRRILLSEVPTLAIETVQITQNTGVIQDEVLAHRIGLLPFNVDPDKIVYKNHDELNAENSLKFQLNVSCQPQDLGSQPYMPIYASHLIWEPYNDAQRDAFKDNPPKPVHEDVLLTKLGPGQEIILTAFLEKGIGKTHAKWSPVSTAVYRFKPEIDFSKEEPLSYEEKKHLCDICPQGVFAMKSNGDISVENVLACTSCRACVERFPKRVVLKKLSNHYVFSVESTGAIPSYTLLIKAVAILKDKTQALVKTVTKLGAKANAQQQR